MKITITRRTCHSIKRTWWGSPIASAIADLKERQKKNPKGNYVIEYNVKSSSTPYRVISLDTVEVEIPEGPDRSEYVTMKNTKYNDPDYRAQVRQFENASREWSAEVLRLIKAADPV